MHSLLALSGRQVSVVSEISAAVETCCRGTEMVWRSGFRPTGDRQVVQSLGNGAQIGSKLPSDNLSDSLLIATSNTR